MKLTLQVFLFCGFLFFVAIAVAQQPPFLNEISQFKKSDSLNFPPSDAILFVGSSSFTKWKDVQEYFPDHKIINRGFGGSSLTDVIRYENEIIFPYHPKQVVIYCGENDFASSDSVTVDTVVERFKTLFANIRKQWEKVPIVYVSMKPSPSRAKLLPKFIEANKEIQEFLKTKDQAAYIDVYHAMLAEDGKPMPGIFLEDNLHMNAKGYAIWQKIFEPYLVKTK